MKEHQIKAFFGIVIIVLLFVLASFFARSSLFASKDLISEGFVGMGVYVFILIIATVVAPVSAVPLIPLATSIWGWYVVGLLNFIGWLSGGVIAFLLSRKYGMPLVKKFVSLKKIEKLEKMIPQENIFWSIVFLRLTVPVDILSYVLGLLSNIKFKVYFWATFIGVLPFAFAFAYVGELSFMYQIISFFVVLVLFFVVYVVLRMRKIRKDKKTEEDSKSKA